MSVQEIKLSDDALRWLNAMGGREPKHVQDDGQGCYVLMSLAGGGWEKVLIPHDREIVEYFKNLS